MKIFYAVQATGNGHISRAMELLPVLEKMGKVDVFLSGSHASLPCSIPVKFRSKGVSLFYSRCGGLDYQRTWKSNSILRAKREALQLPVENYDIVLNDFEYITAQACAIKNIPSVQFGHQASFMCGETPRPAKKNMFGEMILKKYAPAKSYVGLHFRRYAPFIFPPVIKSCFLNKQPGNLGHITIYLPAYKKHCIEAQLTSLKGLHFHWFLEGISDIHRENNITYFPVDKDHFNESLLNCLGIITGGGFETPAEALYLGKRLMSIPIRAQYEQQCNAAALTRMGIPVIHDAATPAFGKQIIDWLSSEQPVIFQEANNPAETFEWLFDHYPRKQDAFNEPAIYS